MNTTNYDSLSNVNLNCDFIVNLSWIGYDIHVTLQTADRSYRKRSRRTSIPAGAVPIAQTTQLVEVYCSA